MRQPSAKVRRPQSHIKLDDDLHPPTSNSPYQSILRVVYRFRIRLQYVLFLLILVLIIVHTVRLNPQVAAKIRIPLWQIEKPLPRHLHILIPASEPSLDLCRTIITGAVLNYPTPTLINWGKESTNGSHPDTKFNIAKIAGIRSWILKQPKERRESEDLMLVIDGYDFWFQLRPSVLLQRFHQALDRSNRLTKLRMGYAYGEDHIGQAVMLGVSKRCEPNYPDGIGCWPVPPSPLSEDIYGRNTDTPQGYTEFSSVRPRFPDSGMIMGVIEDVRQIIQRAYYNRGEEQKGTGDGGDPRWVFNKMVGQQEFQRSIMTERHLSPLGKVKNIVNRLLGHTKPSVLDDHPTREKMEPDKVRMHDFGMGLDYDSMMMHNTGDSKWDARFITYSDKDPDLNIDSFTCTPHLKQLPSDVQRTFILPPRVLHKSLYNATWNDLPLYTQICTGYVPPLIHHQGSREDREELWEQFWMTHRLKDLFETQADYAALNSPEDSNVDVGFNSGSAFTDSGEKLTWNQLCKPFEEELFKYSPQES